MMLAILMAVSAHQIGADPVRAELDTLNAAMVAAFTRDPASVAAFYADDALIAGAGQRARGRADVAAYWRGATMFREWSLEIIQTGGTADAPWQYGRSRLVGRSGRTMDTFFLGLLRRDPAGQLQWVVDAYERERRSVGAPESQRISEAWTRAAGGDAAAMTRIMDNPFSVLAGPASSPTPQIASQRAAGARRSPFDGPGRTTLDGPVITVPLEKEGGFYYATVELNGRPFRFTLETGAGFFAISSRVANAIGVPIETMEVMSGTPAPVAAIDLVRLGGASFHNVTARVRSEWDSGGFDGIISMALLRDTLTTLDLGNRTLRLERGELPPPNDRDVLAMSGEDRGGRVDIPLIIGNQRVAAVLDTRADSWLVAPESLQPQLSLAATPTFVANVRGPSVGAFELRGARLRGDVRIGPLTLENPAVVFRRPPSVLVGVPLLEQFALTIDQKNRRVRITRADGRTSFEMPQQPWEGTTSGPRAAQPSASAQPGDPPTGAWTVGFMMRGAPGGTLTVARVFPDSDAATAGVMVGDQILELDGTPAASMTPAVARAVSARGTPFKVIVSRAGRRLEFTLSPHHVR